jgi:hypothetical protein
MGSRWPRSTPAWIRGSCFEPRRPNVRGMSPGNSRGPGGGEQGAGLLCAHDPGRWIQSTRRDDRRARSLRGQDLEFGEMKNVESRKAGTVMGEIWISGTRERSKSRSASGGSTVWKQARWSRGCLPAAGSAKEGSCGSFGTPEGSTDGAGRGTQRPRRDDRRARSAVGSKLKSGELGNVESRKAGRVVREIWKSGTREESASAFMSYRTGVHYRGGPDRRWPDFAR